MQFTKQQLKELQTEDGHFTEASKNHIEALAGKPLGDVVKEAGVDKPEPPEGDPRKWSLSKKNEFIDQHGRDGYKQLLQERNG